MKYVFFGTPRFAEIVLEGLIDAGFIPAALVCNPDRPMGRKQIITPPLTKQLVTKKGIGTLILQPETLDENAIRQLKAIEPDFFVVAAYAKIIPQPVLDIARLGVLGTHPSLLPYYRGASPIQSVILAGESKTGSSIYKMDAKMDHGPIFAQEEVSLDALTTNYLTLEEQLARLSVKLLTSVIPTLLDGSRAPMMQDESRASFTKKFKTENGFIEYSELDAAIDGNSNKAELILRTINALNPEPGCWTVRDGKRIKLLGAKIVDNALVMTKIQYEGEKPRENAIASLFS